jgi:hypothetical protein
MSRQDTVDSVYVIGWPHMVKVGYSANRRWRDLARRNDGAVLGVWHYANHVDAFNAEALGHVLGREWGHAAVTSDLPRDAGYCECRIVARPDALVSELFSLLDDTSSDRCPDWYGCGRSYSHCAYADAYANAYADAVTQAMHVRTDVRTKRGGAGEREPFGSSAREIRGLK